MELTTFIRALQRWWFIPVVALAAAVAGVLVYHRVTDKTEAAATVAVVQAYVPAPGEYVPAQFAFDSLAESDELSKRIAARLNDGTTADQVRGWLSITLKPQLNRTTPSLLYKVSIKHRNRDTAIKVANIAADEAQKLFDEFNTPAGRDVRAAFQPELDTAQQNVDSSRAALVAFETDNDAFALTQRRDQALGLLSQLQLAQVSASAVGRNNTSTATGASLAAAQQQLSRLLALQPEYDQRTFEIGLAKDAVARLEQRITDLEQAGPDAASALAEANTQFDNAQNEYVASLYGLAGFQNDNGVSALPAAIQSQMAAVNQLTIADASSQASAGNLKAALSRQQAEVDRLTGLEPQYSELAGDLQKAQTQLASIQQKMLDVVAGQTLPASAQSRLMQDARIQSALLFTLLTYGLAVFVALFVSITAVYMLAYFEKTPTTVDDLEALFGAPVIGRVARVAR
jgi:capsular polysaccharide biosynthesis protein/flagellar biosynthesis chaperone FliJ